MTGMLAIALGFQVLLAGEEGGVAAPAPDVRPTLAEIFKPPRLLGVRPQQLSLSASGRFATWRWTETDAETPKLEWWIAPTDASSEPRLLFPAEPSVEIQWSPGGDVLLVRRAGWIERHDFSQLGPDGAAIAQPLFECGENPSRMSFTRDGSRAIFIAGEDNELWVLDLESGARWSPAGVISGRGRWFQVLEECDRIALFAAPPGSAPAAAPAPEAPPPPSAPPEPVRGDRGERGDRGPRQGPEAPKRVLWLVQLSPGNERRATKLEEGESAQVSADGRYVALSRTENEAKRQLVMADYLTETVTTVRVRDNLAGDPAAKTTLALYDVQKDERFAPTIDEGQRFMLLDTEWSPTGSLLLVHRLSGDYHARQLLVFDPATRRAWPLFSERDEAWIGGPTLFADWRRDGSEVVFASERSGFCQLYRAPADGSGRGAGGAAGAHALTSGDFEVQELRLLEDGRHVLLLSNERDPAERDLSLLDLETGERRELASPAGCVDDYAASRDGSRVVFTHQRLGVPSEVWTVATAPGSQPVQLSETATDALRELALPPPEIVEFANAGDGTKLRALLYKPQPFDPAQRGPAVVFVHGAGYLQNVTNSMTEYAVNMLFHHRLARMGFTVLDVDYRHSAGYGRKFRTDVYGHMGGKDLEDELAGVDYLGTLGYVDTTRVGIYGGSYGGFMTLMALFTKPDVFACGAALRSVTDWRDYNAWYTNARLGDPKKDEENYRRSSPIDHADGLQKPLLLLHGMKDSNVFAQDTIRLIEKLIQLGKDFDAMLYPSQDHAFTDPECWIDEYRRIERLFLRELRPETPRDAAGSRPATTNPTRPRPL